MIYMWRLVVVADSLIKNTQERKLRCSACSGFELTEGTTDGCDGRRTQTAALKESSGYSIHGSISDEPRLDSEHTIGNIGCMEEDVDVANNIERFSSRSIGSCCSSDEEVESSGKSNVSSSKPTTSASTFVDVDATTSFDNQNRVIHEEEALESSACSLAKQRAVMDLRPLVVAATRCYDQERFYGSGGGDDSGKGLDRVCVASKSELQLIDVNKCKEVRDRQATSIVTVEMEGVTAAAWNVEGSCLAVGDALGRIHLVLPDGSIMVTQSLDLMGSTAGNQDLNNNNSVNLLDTTTTTNNSSIAVVALEFVYRASPSTKCSDSETAQYSEELVAVTKSRTLLHMGNLCLGGLEKAITASPPDLKTLRSLKSSFSATRVKLSCVPVSLAAYYRTECTSVFLATEGGLSLWQRSRHVPSSPLVLVCETNSVEQKPGGEAFGCGFPTLLQGTSDGSYMLVADSVGGLGCWDTTNNDMKFMHRWRWWDKQDELEEQQCQYTASIESMAMLPEEGSGENRSLCVACIMGSNHLLIALLSPSPPFEASLLYCNEIHIPCDHLLSSSAASLGVTVVSPSRDSHCIFLVSAAVPLRQMDELESSSCICVELHDGREILPLHRMRALIADGAFRDALNLVKEANMNYEEVYLAYLAAAVKRGGGSSRSLENCNSSSNIRLDMSLSTIKDILPCLKTHEALQKAKEILCKASKDGLGTMKAYLVLLRARLAVLASHDRAFRETLLPQVDDCLRRLVTYDMLIGDVGSSSCSGVSINIDTSTVGQNQKMTSSSNNFSKFFSLSVVMKGWNWFRNCKLEDALELCLKGGEVMAAIVIWRRHSFIGAEYVSPVEERRGVERKFEDQGHQSQQHMKSSSSYTYLLLPSLLRKLPTSVPPFPLAVWLKDEVLSILPVEGVIEIRTWAKCYVKRMESTDGSPHSAMIVARAVVEGSMAVIGAAATARKGLRWEQDWQLRWSEEAVETETESSQQQIDREECIHDGGEDPCGFGLTEAYWKPDELDLLTRDLKDLVYAWDHHQLRLSLSEFQIIGREAAVLRVIDRVKDPNFLSNEIQNHVLPLARRFRLRGQECLLRYVTSCTKFITAHRSRKDFSGGSDYCSTELRAVAVVRCMEAEEGNVRVVKVVGEDNDLLLHQQHRSTTTTTETDLRVEAVINLLRSVSFPFSSELLSLAEDALSWKNVTLTFREELQEATRVLNISQIVNRHGVVGFSMVEPSQASIIVRHIAAKVSCSTALGDALQVARAYSHLSERRVYVDYIQNLLAFRDSTVTTAAPSSKESPLGAHCSRVTSILNELPQREACSIVQEVLLYALRTLDDLQQGSLFVREGMKLGEIEGSLGSVFPSKRGLELVCKGSDAEEAMLLTAAACRLTAFLKYSAEEQDQRSRRRRRSSSSLQGRIGSIGSIGPHSLGIAAGRRPRNASYLSSSFLLQVLDTLSNIQCEFGIFVPLNLLEKPRIVGGEWESSEEFSSVMSLLFERIKDIYGGGLCAIREGGSGAAGLRITYSNNSSPPPSNNRTNNGEQQLQQQGREIGQEVDEFLRVRRLAELLSVPWSRVMVHCAEEAAQTRCVKDALRFCRLLTKVQAVNFSGGGGGGSSSLALRDAAVILLKFIALQGKRDGPLSSLSFSDYYHHQHYHLSELEDMTASDIPETAEGLKLMRIVLESMALSLEGIQQCALSCDPMELPRMVDLLQGANTLADLLSRSSAGAEFDSLLNQSQSGSSAVAKAIGISIEGSPAAVVRTTHKGSPLLTSVNGHHGSNEGDGCWGLTWFRAPSLVLPSGLGLRLAGSLMLQEMRIRDEVVEGDPNASSSSNVTSSTTLPARTVAMMRLLEFLENHGGLQLSMHVILSMRLQPQEAFSFLRKNLSAMAIKSLSSLKLDLLHILGLLLSIPQKEALTIYQHALSTTQGDFVRLRELACLGIELGWAWRKNELLTHCLELERNAYWWDVLTELQVPFDHMSFGGGGGGSARLDEDGDSFHVMTDPYALSLVRLILKQSGGNMPLTLDFCAQYGIHRSHPSLIYVEQQLLDDNITSYKQDVLSVLPDIKQQDEQQQLVKLLKRLLSIRFADFPHAADVTKKHDSPSSDGNSSCVSSTDYERLYFICSLLAELSQDEEEVKFITRGIEILVLLENTPLPNSFEQRLPFQSLLLDPWKTLSPFLTPEIMIKLIPLCLLLGLHIGECYLQMVRSMYEVTEMEGNSPPSWASVQPWIEKISPSELACEALVCVADHIESDAEELVEVLQLAISKAKEAMISAEEDEICNFENVAPPPPPPPSSKEMMNSEGFITQTNHPMISTKLPVTAVSLHEGGGGSGSLSSAEKHYKELKIRLCALRHNIVLIDCLGRELANSLSPFFMGGAEDLLLELFSRASLQAADSAVKEEKGCGKEGGCSRMDAYRSKAGNAYRAACLIAEQRGLDSHDVERVRQKLALHWIFSTSNTNEVESAKGSSSSSRDTTAPVKQPSLRGGGGLCSLLLDDNHQTLSAFSKTGRELSKEADILAVLRVAFVSSICSNLDGSIDSILSMDLKTKVDSLLSLAREGRHGKATYRSRWRALHAAGIIAPKRTVAHIYYKSSQAFTQDSIAATSSSPKEKWEKGAKLSMLSNWALDVGYMVDLETLGLGFSLDEIMSCDKANLTRGLLREHPVTTPPMFDRFMPLLCDMCLDAGVTDAPLWDSLLVRMDREGLHRHLLLSVLPRLSYTATRVGELTSTVWSNAMRLPLQQLLNQREALKKARLVCCSSNSPKVGVLVSPPSTTTVEELKYESLSLSTNNNLDQQSLFHDLQLNDIITVLDAVVHCMRRCPCIDAIDVRWHVNAILSLENLFLHQHAISIAASAHLVMERTSLLVSLIRDFGICSSAVLNEVRAGQEVGNDKQVVAKPIHLVETSHRSIVNAIFDTVDSLDKHGDLIDSDHLEAFARYLVLHNREEKLVHFCLAHGRYSEAERIEAACNTMTGRSDKVNASFEVLETQLGDNRVSEVNKPQPGPRPSSGTN